MKILFSPFSPYVRKCLVTAHELGLGDRVQLLPSNAHPVQRDREIIASNPLGKVPTFFTDDGQVLVRVVMFVVPALLIALSYVVYRVWYKLDEARYEEIVEELRIRKVAAASVVVVETGEGSDDDARA